MNCKHADARCTDVNSNYTYVPASPGGSKQTYIHTQASKHTYAIRPFMGLACCFFSKQRKEHLYGIQWNCIRVRFSIMNSHMRHGALISTATNKALLGALIRLPWTCACHHGPSSSSGVCSSYTHDFFWFAKSLSSLL